MHFSFNFFYYLSFIHDKLQCHVYLLMHCMNGTSSRPTPVHILMSLANKHSCILACVRVCMYALRTGPLGKILHCTNTFVIIII